MVTSASFSTRRAPDSALSGAEIFGGCRFSRLAVDVPGLRELELNPVVVDEEGSTAVDARGMVA